MITEEIVFNNDSFVLDSLAFSYSIYNIYFNDKLLLENIFRAFPIYSWVLNDLVFYCDFDKLYLNDGYPSSKYFNLNSTQVEEWQKIRDENAQKRKEGWDIFIKYLSDAGKIVGGTAIERPPTTPELNAISIYPNPTTGELRIRNYELGIKDIQIFDVMGRRYSPPLEGPGEVNISYLPTGIYFVQIATEKGVVTKTVVKL